MPRSSPYGDNALSARGGDGADQVQPAGQDSGSGSHKGAFFLQTPNMALTSGLPRGSSSLIGYQIALGQQFPEGPQP